MILTLKLVIQPSKEALTKLWDVSHRCTELWNACLEQRRNPQAWGKVNVFSQKKELPLLKKECPEFKNPSSQVLQEVIFDVDQGYKMFFTKRKQGDLQVKTPYFKSRKFFYTQTYPQAHSSFVIEDQVLKLSYGKSPKDWICIPIPDHNWGHKLGHPKTVILGRDKRRNEWFVSITHEVKEENRKQAGHVVVFDPGCRKTLTGLKTDGTFYEYDINPLRKVNLETYQLIDRLCSKRDRMVSKTSKPARRLRARMRKLYKKLETRTKTYLHTLAKRILEEHPDVKEFKIGDWDKRKTLAQTEVNFVNKRINRSVQNNHPLNTLIDFLTYKGNLQGQAVKKVDERGTTKTCVLCDDVLKKGLSPEAREFLCLSCKFKYPRDHHSGLNLLKRHEPAAWDRLPEVYSGRSKGMTLSPFSCKPQVTWKDLPKLFAS